MSILRIPDYNELGFEEISGDLCVDIEPLAKPEHCPNCGQTGDKIYCFGKSPRRQLFFDIPHGPQRVILRVKRQRYRCTLCGGTWMQAMPMIDEGHRMTTRLVEHIRKRAMSTTFVAVADEVGVTEGTVRKVFKDHVKKLERFYQFKTPRVLGIDEIFILKRSRAVFTNIEESTLIEMLPNRYKATVTEFLRNLSPGKVEVVTADMWKDYHHAAMEVFPNALVVVDKFHVVRMANDALDRVRKAAANDTIKKRRTLMRKRRLMFKRMDGLNQDVEETLSAMFEAHPLLYEAYILKEMFYAIYDQDELTDAMVAYDQWKAAITPELKPYFMPLERACENFNKAIFNYWKARYTNAYTEGANSFIRGVHNLGRGYSFEVLRAKMLFSQKAMVTTRKIDKDHMYLRLGLPYYGADLSTLSDMLEHGDFG